MVRIWRWMRTLANRHAAPARFGSQCRAIPLRFSEHGNAMIPECDENHFRYCRLSDERYTARSQLKWTECKNMIKQLSILTILLAAALQTGHASDPVEPAAVQTVAGFGASLIPWPANVVRQDGMFALRADLTISANAAFAAEADQLASALSVKSGGESSAIKLKKADGLPAEGYALEVTPSGITITASTSAGAFYGCQTLRQLVSGKNVPCCRIQDAPRISWRGFMLDVSRHFFDKGEIKARLDEMASLKLNVFHWHLTDDNGWRIEIKKYPKLTEVGAWHPITGQEKNSKHSKDGRYGGFYTQDDIREIVAYAAARHIRILPEIDMPGHMSAAAASYPELSPDNGWTPMVARQEKGSGERCAAICVARPKTVQFCKDVLDEVIALFPSKEIHVGGDEVFAEQWEACPEMRAYKEKLQAKHWDDVQIVFQNEISSYLIGKGRTAVFWNNIYRQTVDKRSINHFWRNMANARDFANNGFDVLMSPYVYYLDHLEFSLEATYQYDPMAIGVKPGAEARLRGIEACEWTERIPDEHVLTHRIYPRLVAVAESGWTPENRKNWPSFRKRILTCAAVPEDIRKNLDKEIAKIDFKPFHSAANKKPKPGQGAQPVPNGNHAFGKSSRLLAPDESQAVKPAPGNHADINGIDGNPATDAFAAPNDQGWIYDVDLESLVNARQIKITFGKSETVGPLQVAVSADGIVWNTVYDKIPADRAPLGINFNPAEIRFIRITQKSPGQPIAELEAY